MRKTQKTKNRRRINRLIRLNIRQIKQHLKRNKYWFGGLPSSQTDVSRNLFSSVAHAWGKECLLCGGTSDMMREISIQNGKCINQPYLFGGNKL